MDHVPPHLAVNSRYIQDLGQLLRAARQGAGLSLERAAAASRGEFSAVAIGSYERGERRITADRLNSIARLYDVDTADLLPSTTFNAPTRVTDDEVKILAAGFVRQLTELVNARETVPA